MISNVRKRAKKAPMEKLLLVNEKDEVLGEETKGKCHREDGILHRAFSVYIFNSKGELLIQQRSKFKKLWPFFWTNSCCSHPRKGENYEAAGERRLKEELGFTASLRNFGKFQYAARYKDIGAERELVTLLVGRYDGKIKPDQREVADFKWVDINDLKRNMAKYPQGYTPWLEKGLKIIFKKRLCPVEKFRKYLHWAKVK